MCAQLDKAVHCRGACFYAQDRRAFSASGAPRPNFDPHLLTSSGVSCEQNRGSEQVLRVAGAPCAAGAAGAC